MGGRRLVLVWLVVLCAGGCRCQRSGGRAEAGPGVDPDWPADMAVGQPGQGRVKVKKLPKDTTAQWEAGDRDGKPKPHGEPWDFHFLFLYAPPIKHGRFVLRYKSGKQRLVGQMRDGKADGTWTEYYESGKKRRQGDYRKGKQQGTWIAWYESGRLRGKGQYRDHYARGDFREWHPNGRLWQIYTWRWLKSGSHRHGPGKMWYDDGQLSEAGAYDMGKPVGPWDIWHPNGQQEEHMVWVKGKEHGEIRQWDKAGHLLGLGNFEHGAAVAPWKCRDPKTGKLQVVPTPDRAHPLPTKVCAKVLGQKPSKDTEPPATPKAPTKGEGIDWSK